MQAKEYLMQVRRAETELQLLRARIRHYNDLAASLGGGMAKATNDKPSGASRVEAAAVGLTDLTTELNVSIEKYVALIREAEEKIKKLPQERYRQVLTLRYLTGWSWSSIRDEMGYNDPKSVYRVHGWALQELQKLM